MAAIQPLYLTGKCYWASVVEPNSTFEPAWQLDLCLNEKTKVLVDEAGLNIRNKSDDRGEFITLKRKVQGKNGPRLAPKVVDSQNNPWVVEDEDGKSDYKLIGNGSVVTVKALPYEWNYAGKSGKSADLAAVQVIELIEYGNEGFDIVDGGYVNEATSEISDDIPFSA
tara:strand:- start:1004 stop:1507 length:504 start_codon:yes stop_codon:yes gene_type:complete